MRRGLPFFIAFAIILITDSVKAATITPISNGIWYQTTIWPGGVLPTLNDDVIIPQGMDVVMAGTMRAKSITVNGTLRGVNWQPQGAWIELQTEYIMVGGASARFEIGTEAQRYHATGGCRVTLVGTDDGDDIMGMGDKFIVAMNGGTIELHGEERVSWTNLETTIEAGLSTIQVKDPVDWVMGDKIVLTSTSLDWTEVDEAEIQSVSLDGKTITLTAPVEFRHIGGEKTYTRSTDGKQWTAKINGEVGLLSHNILIQGDDDNESTGFGGHIMVMPGASARIEQVELFQMGQKTKLGRYPFHWHLVQDGGAGQYIKNCSVHKSYNRAVTVHGTDYALVEGVVAYDHIGHGMFLEDGGERYNTFKDNLVFMTRRPAAGEELTPSDNEANEFQNRTPSSYWITNPNNYFDGNVAAGTEGTGFWFAMPESPMFSSGSLPYFQGIQPHKEPLGSLTNFVVHSCQNGFDLFDRLNPDHSLKKNWGWEVSTNQYITNGMLYANGQAIYCGLGVGDEPSKIVFQNCTFSDNELITMLAANLALDDCLFNVDTDFGVFDGRRSFYWFYDGPGKHTDCHFEGWDRTYARMIKESVGVGAVPNPNPTFQGTTKGFSGPFRFEYVDIEDDEAITRYSLFFKDYDGGLLGKPNTTLVPDHPFYTDGSEYKHESWYNAARSDHFFASIRLNLGASLPSATITRTKAGTPTACAVHKGGHSTFLFGGIVNENYLYTVNLHHLPTQNMVGMTIHRGEVGDMVTTRFKNMAQLQGVAVNGGNGLAQVNSLTALENATGDSYYISTDDIYVKIRHTNNHGYAAGSNISITWTGVGDFTLPVSDCDGDGMSDEEERNNGRTAMDESDFAFEFNGTNESFVPVNIAAQAENPNEWLVRVDNHNDPQLVRTGLYFRGEKVPTITVRARSQQAGTFQLFWGHSGADNFSAARVKNYYYDALGEFEEFTFELAGDPEWDGKRITRIRLDIPSDPNSQKHTWIDWIRGPRGGDNVDSDGDGSSDLAESSVCNRDAYDSSDMSFEFDGTRHDFNMANITANSLGSGTNWLLRADYQNDPFIHRNDFLEINGSQTQKIKVRTRCQAAGNFQLFWTHSTSGGFAGNMSKTVNYPNANQWVTLEFDMTGHPEWDGKTITSLRLDFPVNANAQIHTWIDYMRGDGFHENSENAELATADVQVSLTEDDFYLFSQSCDNLIAKVQKTGANPLGGTVEGKVWLQASQQSYNDIPYLRRHFEITPATNPEGVSGSITLYVDQADFNAFNASAGTPLLLPTDPSDTQGIANIRISKFGGTSSNGSGHPSTYPGDVLLINPDDSDIVWNTLHNRWEITFDVVGFSGFFIHSGNSVLPVELISFTVTETDCDAHLKWVTANEENNSHFIIEYGTDGVDFEPVAYVEGQGTTTEETSYHYVYPASRRTHNYFRLKQVDFDGSYSYSETLYLRSECGLEDGFLIYPNPTKDKVTLEFKTETEEEARLEIFDALGRKRGERLFMTVEGISREILDLEGYNAGTYTITLVYGSKRKTLVVVKVSE